MSTRWLKTLLLLALVAVVVGGGSAGPVTAHFREVLHHQRVERFATLPVRGPGFPEGLAADAAGNIYVATFDFEQTNNIYVFTSKGKLRTTIPLPGVAPLGLAFGPGGHLYVADFLGGTVHQFVPPFTANSSPATVFAICANVPGNCGLNAIAFDAAGDLYVSDSFGGRIFKIDLPGGAVSTFLSDELLTPGSHGFPPFGANGLAFDAAGHLYIANTADDRILRYNIDTQEVSVFAESINGADGIVFDRHGRLWVAANQADEIVALNPHGRVIARVGSFKGIGHDGAVHGLLFPASIVFSKGDLYVTNLALALTEAEGDEPEEDVTRFTVSKIELGWR